MLQKLKLAGLLVAASLFTATAAAAPISAATHTTTTGSKSCSLGRVKVTASVTYSYSPSDDADKADWVKIKTINYKWQAAKGKKLKASDRLVYMVNAVGQVPNPGGGTLRDTDWTIAKGTSGKLGSHKSQSFKVPGGGGEYKRVTLGIYGGLKADAPATCKFNIGLY